MTNLLRSEWIKLTKRPLTWMLLAAFLVLLVLQFLQFYFITTLAAQVLPLAQVEDVRRRLAFPGAFGAIFGHINGLGGVFAAVLAVGFVGSDYSWGTLRTYLARRPDRGAYIVAKLLVLLGALLLGMLIALVAGALTALAFGSLVGGAGVPDLAALADLPLALARALLVLLPYVLAAVAATVYGRSLIVGLVVGLLFQFVDIIFGAITTFAELGGIWPIIYQFLLQANVTTLTTMNSRMFGLDPAAIDRKFDPALLPSPLQATLVIALYCALFLAVTLWSFRRRDITGAI